MKKVITALVASMCSILLAEIILTHTRYGKFERFFNTYIPKDYQHAAWYFKLPNHLGSNDFITILDKTIPISPPRDEQRILFIGDSGTRGVGVEIPQAFPYLIEKKLGNVSNNIVVLNAGIPGMYPAAELDFFKSTLIKINPTIVILGIFISNDITFNIGHEHLEIKNASHLFSKYLRRHSALINFISLNIAQINSKYKWYGKLTHNPKTNLIDENGLNMTNYIHGEYAIYQKEYSSLVKKSFLKVKDILEEFVKLGNKHSFKFGVVIIPSLSAIQNAFDIPWTHDEGDPNNSYRGLSIGQIMKKENITDFSNNKLDFTKPYEEIKSICSSLKIKCFDPLKQIKKTIGIKALRTEYNDDHLSIKGHQMIADKMESTLRKWLLLVPPRD